MPADEDIFAAGFAARNFGDDVVNLDVFADVVFEAELDFDGAVVEEALEEQGVFFAEVAAGNVGERSGEGGVTDEAGGVVGGAEAEDKAARALFADQAERVEELTEAKG